MWQINPQGVPLEKYAKDNVIVFPRGKSLFKTMPDHMEAKSQGGNTLQFYIKC